MRRKRQMNPECGRTFYKTSSLDFSRNQCHGGKNEATNLQEILTHPTLKENQQWIIKTNKKLHKPSEVSSKNTKVV